MIHEDLRRAIDLLVEVGVTLPEGDESLSDRLYAWYLNSTPLPAPEGRILPFEYSPPAALRAAHTGARRFEGGWRTEAVSSLGRAVARSGGSSRVLERGEYIVVDKIGRKAEPGDPLFVCSRWDWVDDATGFWHARRGEWPPTGADRLVRTYWNCTPRTAPLLLAELTKSLDEASSVPYMLKTAAVPEYGGRADGLVLYLGPEGFATVETALRGIAMLPRLELRPERPRMTCGLAAGVGLAEGRVEGDSFGQVRCNMIAAAFRALPAEGRGDSVALERALRGAFADAGLDVERPYLEPKPLRDYVR